MNREQIERLAMDSAAGELNEDVEALLLEYLKEHKEANEWFLEMKEIYKKTQDAFETKTSNIIQSINDKPSQRINMMPIVRLAAMIAIAACIGIIAGRLSKQNISQHEPKNIASVTSRNTNYSLDNIEEGFWKNKIAAMVNPSYPRANRKSNSNASLLEQYRQYLKEKKS